MEKRDEAMLHQISWKPETKRYAVAVTKKAIELYRRGICKFGPDDMEEGPEGANSDGIAGGVFRWLRSEGVIRHVVAVVEGEEFLVQRPSKRPKSNGRRVCLYELTNMVKAETFIERNSPPCEEVKREQMTLAV